MKVYLLVRDNRNDGREHREMKGSVYDAIIPVVLGHQYLVGRTADYWLYTPAAEAAMDPAYREFLERQIALRPGAKLTPLADYLDEFYSFDPFED